MIKRTHDRTKPAEVAKKVWNFYWLHPRKMRFNQTQCEKCVKQNQQRSKHQIQTTAYRPSRIFQREPHSPESAAFQNNPQSRIAAYGQLPVLVIRRTERLATEKAVSTTSQTKQSTEKSLTSLGYLVIIENSPHQLTVAATLPSVKKFVSRRTTTPTTNANPGGYRLESLLGHTNRKYSIAVGTPRCTRTTCKAGEYRTST